MAYGIRTFFQSQLLGMQWLKSLTGALLSAMGLDITSRFGGSIHFFLYDSIKITLLLCVFIFLVSFLQSYFPPERSKRIMGRFRGLGANTAAALLGTVTPFCACSSIPIFMGFTAAGLPFGVTFSFLISSPMVDLGSLMLLTGVFGGKIALLYVLLGLLVAILGGALLQKLHMENQVEEVLRRVKPPEAEVPQLKLPDRLSYAREQTLATLRRVFPYLLLGTAIGALIHNWIPPSWVESLLGAGNPAGVPLAVLLGAPMYADIFGTLPVAEALLAKGARLGAVLSFMMAVTTLSLPSLVMLRRAIKPKLLGAFTAICLTGILLVGCLFNLLQPVLMG